MKSVPPLKSLLLPLISALMFTCFSCAARPTLRIDYRLPMGSEAPFAGKVIVKARDARGSAATLSPAARSKLKDFTDHFSLALGQGAPEGIYELEDLFSTALKERVLKAGFEVLPFGSPADPALIVNINAFFLDYVEFKWKLAMGIDVQLVRDRQVVASRSVSGSAERVRVPGKKDADKLVSEIFTDIMNRIDLAALLKNA